MRECKIPNLMSGLKGSDLFVCLCFPLAVPPGNLLAWLYPKQREDPSAGRSLSPALVVPRWRINLQFWVALLGAPAFCWGACGADAGAGGPHGCPQHPAPLLQHRRPGKSFLGVYFRPWAELGSAACLSLCDLSRSAFGFQCGFGTGLKIPRLRSTSSELVKKTK